MLEGLSPFTAEAKLYVSVFIDMERSTQLQSYYSQCHKVIIYFIIYDAVSVY